MKTTVEKGRDGESLAAEFLEAKGYRVLERNYRAGRGELDLICLWREKCLIFVEVKLRGSAAFGRPEEFVGRKKEEMMAQAAAAYCRSKKWEREIRFDVVSILMRTETELKSIEHFEDAFFPGWR